MTTPTCDCLPDRWDLNVQVYAGDIVMTHIHCGKRVDIDMDRLMSNLLPMTMSLAVDEAQDETYWLLTPATSESAEA